MLTKRALKAEIHNLRTALMEVQHQADILAGQASRRSHDANPYPSYEAQVLELSRKYEGVADWGCLQIANILEIRAAFILGSGVKPVAKGGPGDGQRELQWIKDFLDQNNLDEEVAQGFAKEAEIEGKILLRLIPDLETKRIEVRYIPWTLHRYQVHTPDEDYARYTEVTYRLENRGREIRLKPHEFVFKRFGGRTHNVNVTPPKCGRILRAVESLDRALLDWRKFNQLFGNPTPHFRCSDNATAWELWNKLKEVTWKVGTFLCTSSEFSIVGPPTAGIDSLEREITRLAQLISGATGVPVHFLGLPELLSNRSTAENLMELVAGSTNTERRVWVGAYEELFQKALAMANTHLQKGFNPEIIGAEIEEMSATRLKEVTDVWLPVRAAGEISRETFLEKLPGIDPEAEAERIRAESESAAADMMHLLAARAGLGDDPDQDGDKPGREAA